MIFQQARRLLSHPAASIICLPLACLGRIGHVLFNSVLMTDRSYQLQAAKNFFQGKGITILEANFTDLSKYEYLPLIKWPPAYSLLAAPFNFFGENGYLVGAVALDVLAALLFIFAARKIFKFLEPETWLLNLYTLVIGFHFYHFGYGWSTDMMSLAFLLWGVYFCLRILKKSRSNLSDLIPAILFLWLSGFTRYLSIPLAFVPPFVLILYGILNKTKPVQKGGFAILIRLFMLFGIQFLTQKLLSTSSLLYPFEKGFFPENLLQTGPFVFEAMGNLEPVATLLVNSTSVSLTGVQQAVVAIHFALLLLLLGGTAVWLFRRRFKTRNSSEILILLSFFICMATLLVLGYLSLRFASSENVELRWTYLSELRYYAAAIFFIQLCLFIYAFKEQKNRTVRYLFSAIMFLMIASAIYGVYFLAKSAIKEKTFFYQREAFTELNPGLSQLDSILKTTETPVICTSNEPMFTNLATLRTGVPGLHSIPDSISSFSSSKPLTVFIAIKKRFGSVMVENRLLHDASMLSETESWIYYLKKIGLQ